MQNLHPASYHENQPASPEKNGEVYPNYFDEVPDLSKMIMLPEVSHFKPKDNNFVHLLEKRRSLRRYDETALMSLEELSYLLKFTQGIRETDEKRAITMRYVPSAGSRHPFETYLLIQRVEGLQAGLYRYVSRAHALTAYDLSPEAIQKTHEVCALQKQVITSAVTFFWIADVYRTAWRYTTRAYRYINIDAGHVCQNLHLCAESIDYGVCAIGAFDDRKANQLFDCDEVDRFVVYAASVGKKENP
jgi:SagB-type dehydrogenase family enzyme